MPQQKILIIDDEEDICLLLGNMLRKKKFEVICANDLANGLKNLDEVKPSLLFLDINLPDGSGLDALHNIRKKYPLLKVIVMSAYDGIKERNMAEQRGANSFIGKPLSIELINQTLAKLEISG